MARNVILRTVCACALLTAMAVTGEEPLPVGEAWAGHPVRFCLLTNAPNQYAAYYDADRRLTVGQRRLDESSWTLVRLDERVGWDSHNYIVMTLDDAGHLHLSGNMHVHPLKYFRTTEPGDIRTLERVPAMTGSEEDRVTYPRFFRGPDGRLVFTYRDGSSGAGSEIYNVYDPETRLWSRLLDTPLTDGRGDMNAYPTGPTPGPDGFWRLCWVWRDTPDCATNHDLCYARSRDLVHWETSGGAPLALPITFETAEVADPVPPGGGIINGNTRIGFDLENRLVLAYHKHDAKGFTQVFNARREADGWRIYQTSDWDYRWEFSGGGSIPFEIRVSPVAVSGGQLVQDFSHDRFGGGRWVLDPETLKPVATGPRPAGPIPAELQAPESDFPGMRVNWQSDSGQSDRPGVSYYLRWETLGANRDRPREEPWPGPTALRLYTFHSE